MADLLNPDQLRSVTIVLRMFEENLRQAEISLKESEVTGILYQRKLIMTPDKRREAEKLIVIAYKYLQAAAAEFGMDPEVEDVAGLISGEMSVSWANLLDTRSVKLRRFGVVDPRLEDVLDPMIQHLAQLALTLATLFGGQIKT